MMNRTGTLLLFLLACPLAGHAASKPQPLPPMTAETWRADLDFFARELPRRHKNAFHTLTREQLAAEVASLRARAGQANDDEMIVGLMRIAAMVGDGHTYVRLPSSLHQFPVAVANIEGAYRVVRGAGPAAELVGGKLIRIDGTSIEEAAARIRTILPQAESDVLFAAFTPQWLSIAEVMHGLGIARSAAAARSSTAIPCGRSPSTCGRTAAATSMSAGSIWSTSWRAGRSCAASS